MSDLDLEIEKTGNKINELNSELDKYINNPEQYDQSFIDQRTAEISIIIQNSLEELNSLMEKQK